LQYRYSAQDESMLGDDELYSVCGASESLRVTSSSPAPGFPTLNGANIHAYLLGLAAQLAFKHYKSLGVGVLP